ncbi:LANO_0H13828g1_1 [Lachancea nothofagi CBS 11611]|uniref:LANO_0H13828g1_1 n=1 Tax=Lachancea nothofagi CBS 11611 TaxID=1266666 RepID=A0A1G4KMT7_9SACH|nr:LANO_0H13828g1_1 [Lachancea nothofagi CBS 11611]
MNFLFKSFSGFQFPYSLEAEPTVSTPIWQAVDGHRKSDSLPVTVFSFERSKGNSVLEGLVANAIHHFKVLKLPGIVKVLDVLETNPATSYVVTERVSPLVTKGLSQQALNLGIYQLSETLECLHNQAQVVLASLTAGTVFVNQRGEWCLFGLELCSKISDLSFLKRNVGPYTSLAAGTVLEVPVTTTSNADSVLLAKFISAICVRIPSEWNQLLASLEHGRLTLAQFVSRARETRPFQSTLIAIYQDLKEFHIKDPQGKLLAMTDLQRKIMDDPAALRGCTPGFVEHYLIPEIAHCISTVLEAQQQQPNTTTATTVVSFLASLLELTCSESSVTDSKPVFDKYVKPIIFENFKQSDRQLRFLLLVYLTNILPKLTNSEVSDRIFPHFVQGLADSDGTMRIQTLKKIPDIVPMITERQLNNDLLRHLAKTQVDSNVEIRTWTILTISGLSKKLSASNNRSGILATAFTKSLKDPQIKPKLAALYGLETSLELFDTDTIANKILTVIAPGLLDKNRQVRSKAKELFRLYLTNLEEEADKIPTDNSEEISVDFGASITEDETNVVKQFMDTLKLSAPPVMPQNEAEALSAIHGDGEWVTEDAGWEETEDWDNELAAEKDTHNSPQPTDSHQGKKVASNIEKPFAKKSPGKGLAGKVKIQKSWNDELEDDDWDSWSKPANFPSTSKEKPKSTLARKSALKGSSNNGQNKDNTSVSNGIEDDTNEDGWGDEW